MNVNEELTPIQKAIGLTLGHYYFRNNETEFRKLLDEAGNTLFLFDHEVYKELKEKATKGLSSTNEKERKYFSILNEYLKKGL